MCAVIIDNFISIQSAKKKKKGIDEIIRIDEYFFPFIKIGFLLLISLGHFKVVTMVFMDVFNRANGVLNCEFFENHIIVFFTN